MTSDNRSDLEALARLVSEFNPEDGWNRDDLIVFSPENLQEFARRLQPARVPEGDGREAFDSWVGRRWGLSLSRWEDSGEYTHHQTRNFWQCWTASRNALLAAAPAPDHSEQVLDMVAAPGDSLSLHGAAGRSVSRPGDSLHGGEGPAVAYLVDWPDEPELGHTLSEQPAPHARNRPLGMIAPPPRRSRARPIAWTAHTTPDAAIRTTCRHHRLVICRGSFRGPRPGSARGWRPRSQA